MNILFICTHNRCRSVLCEALTNHLSEGRIRAYSAGSSPAGEVHPLTLKYLQERGIPIHDLRSQSWDEMKGLELNAVITVCDSAAKEQCPIWFDKTIQVHWGLPDPSKSRGAESEVKQQFMALLDTIELAILTLLSSSFEEMDESELKNALNKMEMETVAKSV